MRTDGSLLILQAVATMPSDWVNKGAQEEA